MGSGEPEAAEGHRSAAPSVEDLHSRRTAAVAADAAAAGRGREQLEALLDVVTAVSADIELPEVLARIVRSSCAVVNARYGALGVLAPDREHLVEFVTHGVTPQERELIGEPPHGHGVLGLLIRDPRPRRLSDIAAHPDSYGFPPNHPRMRSFLGTPILVRNEVFGNLYLADREGEPEFTEADEATLVALAAAAGVAIENARLYERAQRQRRWAQATGTLTQSLLEGDDEDRALRLMVELVCRLTASVMCAVALRDESGYVLVRATHHVIGEATGALEEQGGWPMLDGAAWAEALAAGRDLLLIPSPGDREPEPVAVTLASVARLDAPGPVAVVPISVGTGDIGYVLLAWAPDQTEAARESMADVAAFARHAGLALAAARALQDRALLARSEDRDRIARDMHDHVIQRLFATGLSLQSVAKLAVHPLVQQRLDEAVDSLDGAIKDIRSTIFDLHTSTPSPPSASAFLEELVGSYAGTLGFAPALEVDGDLASLDEQLRDDVAAVIREGLANIRRHARATAGRVTVTCGSTVRVEIVDDGVGIGSRQRRSGLANLEHRATSHSGTMTVTAAQPTGTRLSWSVPLSAVRGPSTL